MQSDHSVRRAQIEAEIARLREQRRGSTAEPAINRTIADLKRELKALDDAEIQGGPSFSVLTCSCGNRIGLKSGPGAVVTCRKCGTRYDYSRHLDSGMTIRLVPAQEETEKPPTT